MENKARKNPPPLERQRLLIAECPDCGSHHIEKVEAGTLLTEWHTWRCRDCDHRWYYDGKKVRLP